MAKSDEMSTKVPKTGTKRGYGGRDAEQLAQERRQRLMDTALELFGTVGYLPTTVEKLCSAAKVTTRHFYEHFPDREALLIAVFEDILLDSRQRVLAIMLASQTPLEQRFLAGIEAFLAAHLDDPRRARITTQEIMGVSQNAEAHRHAVITGFADLIETVLASLAAEGRLPVRNYRVLAYGMVGAMHELQIAWLHQAVPQSRAELMAEIRFCLSAMLTGAAQLAAGQAGV